MAAPISVLDYSTITRALLERREWEGARNGVPMRLVKFTSREGEVVEIALKIKHGIWIHQRCRTILKALDECNRLISARHGTSPVVAVPIAAAAVSRATEQWLPYKDA